MIQKPYLSIIIPIYKVEKQYLTQCIESVINQTLENIEIIIVEDGCDNALKNLCSHYADSDKRIKIIYQDNSGVSVARNQGINKASADWLIFLDADDWLEKDACLEIYNVIKDNRNINIDIIQFISLKSYKNKEIPFHYGFKSGIYLVRENTDNQLYLTRRIIQPTHFFKHSQSDGTIYHIWDKAFKKSLLTTNNISFPEGISISEDKVFMLDCVNSFDSMYMLSKPLHHYRESMSSVKHSFSKTLDLDRLKLFELLMNKIKSYANYSSPIKKQLQYDLDGFIVACAGEVIIRKFYHSQYCVSPKERKKDAESFFELPVISSALKSISTQDLYFKNAIIMFLLKHKLYSLLYIIFTVINNIKGHQN